MAAIATTAVAIAQRAPRGDSRGAVSGEVELSGGGYSGEWCGVMVVQAAGLAMSGGDGVGRSAAVLVLSAAAVLRSDGAVPQIRASAVGGSCVVVGGGRLAAVRGD